MALDTALPAHCGCLKECFALAKHSFFVARRCDVAGSGGAQHSDVFCRRGFHQQSAYDAPKYLADLASVSNPCKFAQIAQ